jgi:alpha-L-fucosidase
MFIHFGLYSVPGGIWEGRQVPNYSEQIQAHGGIYSDYYRDLTLTFDPTAWNADSIVALAKRNGMRSIVLTTKHHDGFCMYHSKQTTFNVVDATPYKTDVLRTLADACRKADMNLGLYFSLIDWTLHPITAMNINTITDAHHAYNMRQIEELLTGYGPISELWFDMGSMSEAQSREMYALVHRLQPDCMVSGRLGNNSYDFCVMADNEYPDYALVRPWQTAASIYSETWGYRSWQPLMPVADKVAEKIASLTHVVSRGGNYLLNIGPKGDGSVTEHEHAVLDGIGAWIARNGEALYGVEANPFGNRTFAWGDIVRKGNTLYLYLNGDRSTALSLPVEAKQVRRASLVGSKSRVSCKADGKEGVVVTVDASVYENPTPVVKLELRSADNLAPQLPTIASGLLNYKNAENHYSFACRDYYTTHRSVVASEWHVPSAASLALLYPAAEAGKTLRATFDGESQRIELNPAERTTVRPSIQVVSTAFTMPRGAQFLWEESKLAKQTFVDAAPSAEFGLTLARPTLFQTAVYVKQVVESAEKQLAQVEIDAESGVMLFHNGKEVTKNLRTGRQIVMLELEAGKNELVYKLLCKNEAPTQSFRIAFSPEFELCRQPLAASPRTIIFNGLGDEKPYPQSLHEVNGTHNICVNL